MNKTPELKPCPFCGSEYLTISHDDHVCSCKISCECGCSVEWLSDCMTKEDLEKLVIKKWNNRVYPKETDLYIHHPVTGERMDKAQCKRIITQMHGCIQDMDSLIKDRDHCHEMADKLADAVAEHFGVDIGEHSNANDPWENALNCISSFRPVETGYVFRCGQCGMTLKKWNYCPNCGQQLKWSDK